MVQIDAAALLIVRFQNVFRILRVVSAKGPFALSFSLNAAAPDQFGVATHFRLTSRNLQVMDWSDVTSDIRGMLLTLSVNVP